MFKQLIENIGQAVKKDELERITESILPGFALEAKLDVIKAALTGIMANPELTHKAGLYSGPNELADCAIDVGLRVIQKLDEQIAKENAGDEPEGE
jgi:hypothetical protein